MSSSGKTSNLGLNQWSGSDKPKRSDFNKDNSLIDEKLGEHLNNGDIHVTLDDKEAWNAPFEAGNYRGTGVYQMDVTLGYKPSAVFVAAHSFGLTYNNTSNATTDCYSGFAYNSYGTPGITITDTGFKVTNSTAAINTNYRAFLNTIGNTYLYIAFK